MTQAAVSGTRRSGASGERIFNFSAGPGVLPESVLQQCQEDVFNIMGSGIGILEHSHRGKVFDRLLEETFEAGRKVANLPDDYDMLFVQGGASSQCFMVPANYLPEGGTADYYRTGKWAKDSIKEAKLYGTAHVCFDGEPSKFSRLPASMDEVKHSASPAYVHFTSNNTIMGTQWHNEPTPPAGVELVCDASSDIFSKPIDVRKYALIYAGAQKNLGPAGTVMVIGKKDWLQREPVRPLPTMLKYKTHAENESRYNTPPTFGIYLIGQVFKWILAEGGVEEMQRRNEEKAGLIYGVIDQSSFYKGHAEKHCRSLMNITFTMPTPELEDKFIKEAEASGMDGLKGHRSVGGVRASIYNAMPRAGCEALASFMREFERTNG